MDYLQILRFATEAAENSYSPYSRFPVGAAAIGADGGSVYEGCNIENASFGLTVCAERAAIFKAISSGEKRIKMLACTCLNGDWNNFRTLTCCGACRQVMQEFMDDDAPVVIGIGENYRVFRLDELLPMGFTLNLTT